MALHIPLPPTGGHLTSLTKKFFRTSLRSILGDPKQNVAETEAHSEQLEQNRRRIAQAVVS